LEKKHSTQSKEKISKATSGTKNYFYGKSFAGENHPQSKINQLIADEIRNMYLGGRYTYADLAEMYNLGITHVGRIINNKVWKKIVQEIIK